MPSALAHRPLPDVVVRKAEPADLEGMLAIEERVFSTDLISRRALRRFLVSPHAAVIAADLGGRLAGYAIVLFRTGTAVARLYSIAVAPECGGRGVGTALLEAAEAAALDRGCLFMRLEVNEANKGAIARYRKLGYRQFGRYERYYEDGSPALRFEKRLTPSLAGLKSPPPYFHQTTEFTCGPACVLMALAWADPAFRPTPALELRLWREATTIHMSSGPGGCEPVGLAVALKRRGLEPAVHVSRPAPYFLDTVRSAEKRRVMRLAQEEFGREAAALRIPIRLARLSESALMEAFDSGAVAIVLVTGYRMLRRRVPHWVFAFGHEERRILLHDPAAPRDEHGNAAGPETYAVPLTEYARMSHFGDLSATILIRKGSDQ